MDNSGFCTDRCISPLDAELEYLGFFIPKASFKYSGVLVIEMLVCVTL